MLIIFLKIRITTVYSDQLIPLFWMTINLFTNATLAKQFHIKSSNFIFILIWQYFHMLELSAYPDVCILSKITASFILVCCTFPFLVNNYSMCTLFSGV